MPTAKKRLHCNLKREGKKKKKKAKKEKNLRLQNVLLKETAPCHPFPDIITYAITGNVRRTMCHPISACWRPVRNRSIYREAVSFTMVNMCVVGQWRLDGFAAAWHLMYGCMQGEGWSRPPLSLNQIIAAAREKKQKKNNNKWWKLASFNSLSHVFILFIWRGALPFTVTAGGLTFPRRMHSFCSVV